VKMAEYRNSFRMIANYGGLDKYISSMNKITEEYNKGK